MRLLLDSCTWGGTVATLESEGHDVNWAGRWNEDPGDEAILDIAHSEHRILVALDKDFGELAIVKGIPHSGIVRIVGGSVTVHARLVQEALVRYSAELGQGAIVTVEESRTRIRLAE
ncbi:MAG: DUF5615 family PIN-like protein [Thermoanaerobaculia bacterium]|jgi:predicted nuclease of predicted toxin-antitoxin system